MFKVYAASSYQVIKNCTLIWFVGLLIIFAIILIDGFIITHQMWFEWMPKDSLEEYAQFKRVEFTYKVVRNLLLCSAGAWLILRLTPRKTLLFGLISAAALTALIAITDPGSISFLIANPNTEVSVFYVTLILGLPLMFWFFAYLQRKRAIES